MCGGKLADVWSGYTTREAAQIVGLPVSSVRGCLRAGLLQWDELEQRVAFRDLRVLGMVKELLAAGISWPRLRRQLAALRRRLPDDVSLSELSLAVVNGHLAVRENCRTWRADTGQSMLGF